MSLLDLHAITVELLEELPGVGTEGWFIPHLDLVLTQVVVSQCTRSPKYEGRLVGTAGLMGQ
jgi:hypothetical protein